MSTSTSKESCHAGAEEQAALEMLLVMLPEYCMQQAPLLTSQILREWELGRAGPLKQKLAELEVRHARAVGVEPWARARAGQRAVRVQSLAS